MPGEPSPGAPDLTARVLADLRKIRSAKGKLTPQKLSRFPALLQVMGADDLLDAFMAFRRELRRYIATANRDEAAAALSIYADYELVLDRLQETANQYSAGDDLKDQRTARHWSDRGMPQVAEDLVYMAHIKGRLGRELLELSIQGHDGGGIMITIEQMVQAALDVQAPSITLWAMNANGDPQERTIDLRHHSAVETVGEEYRSIEQRVVLAPELLERITRDHGLTLAVTGRDAPMRTISFTNSWQPPAGLKIAMSAYRTRATVEITRHE